MSNNVYITGSISTTDSSAPLGFELWIDGERLYNQEHVTDSQEFSCPIVDLEDVTHEIKFVLKNKLPEHTKIDEQNNILSDAVLKINDLKIDGIELGQVFVEHSEYHHDFNSTGPATVEKFYGSLGCNGHVIFKITTPFYLWLLENI